MSRRGDNQASSWSTEELVGSWICLGLVRRLPWHWYEIPLSLSLFIGNETISHLYEPGNGRITVLFQAFEGPPRIIRLYGKGMFRWHLIRACITKDQ